MANSAERFLPAPEARRLRIHSECEWPAASSISNQISLYIGPGLITEAFLTRQDGVGMALQTSSPQFERTALAVEESNLPHLTYQQIVDLMVRAFRLEYLADVRQNMIGFDQEAFYANENTPVAGGRRGECSKYPWKTATIGQVFPIPASVSHLAYQANKKYAPRKFAVKREGYKYLVERVA